jgi:hypothetical protein
VWRTLTARITTRQAKGGFQTRLYESHLFFAFFAFFKEIPASQVFDFSFVEKAAR